MGEGKGGGEGVSEYLSVHFYRFDVQWAHLVALIGIVDRQ
jgi:hypothetical protein